MSDVKFLAWHFLKDNWRTGSGDLLVKPGEILVHDGRLEPCYSGLHASTRAIDALRYAPGKIITLVECIPPVVTAADKFVCTQRKALWGYDAEEELRQFARLAALEVLGLWNAPQVVVDYLNSGDPVLRDEARNAAYAANAATNAYAYAADAYAADAANAAAAAYATADVANAAAAYAANAAAYAYATNAANATATADAYAANWDKAREAERAKQNEILESLLLSGALERGLINP